MKTFSITAADITHLTFSTVFYLDELNPVISLRSRPHNFELSHIISTMTEILSTACFSTTRNEWWVI